MPFWVSRVYVKRGSFFLHVTSVLESYPLIQYFELKSAVNLRRLFAYCHAQNSKFEFPSGDIFGNSCRISGHDCRSSLLIEIQEESISRFKEIDKRFLFRNKPQSSTDYENRNFPSATTFSKQLNIFDKSVRGWCRTGFEFYRKYFGTRVAL